MAPKTYGTVAPAYVSVAGLEFIPFENLCNWTSSGESRWSDNCAGFVFMAPLRLPQGAKLLFLELDSVDTDPASYALGDLWVCASSGCHYIVKENLGTVGPSDCPPTTGLCSGPSFSGGMSFVEADLSPYNITIDNFFNTYTLVAGRLGFGSDPSGAVRLRRMQITYVLQVSPPPAVATFNDVPTNHPFFQFIEALAASGITAGCNTSPPLYCPDKPVTRGQMAVFLAKALGLQWQ